MTGFARFDELAVGDNFPGQPLNFVVSPERVAKFLGAIGADPMVGTNAPSMLAAVYLVDLLKSRNSPPGGIHAKQGLRFFRSLRVGEVLSVQGKIIETYERRGRPYVVSDFETRDADGGLVASGRITSIWGKDP